MTARFITEDTYRGQKNDPLSLNLYTYCHNSPIMYTDPSGHSIKKGDTGKNVAAIQRTLKAEGYYTGAIDGKFGPKTEAAVRAFQDDNNLKTDGIVGSKTTAALYGTKTDTMTTADRISTGTTFVAYKSAVEMANIGGFKPNKQTDEIVPSSQADHRYEIRDASGLPDNPIPNNKDYLNSEEAFLFGFGCALSNIDIPADAIDGYRDNYKAGRIAFHGLSLIGGFAVERFAVTGSLTAVDDVVNTVDDMAKGASNSSTTVGRWMSEAEYKQMVKTGKVQESFSGTTHVANPASAEAFGKQAQSGSVYVEFDIPTASLKQTGIDWAKILGPNTIESKLAASKGLPVYEMPNATNIKIITTK